LTEFKPPLELFSLEEEAAQLPGGLFVFGMIVVKSCIDSVPDGTVVPMIRIYGKALN